MSDPFLDSLAAELETAIAHDEARRQQWPGEDELHCLNASDECSGAVEWRPTPPSGESARPRCVFHHERRWERYEGSLEQEAQSPTPPPWFDPDYAGERWDEDDA